MTRVQRRAILRGTLLVSGAKRRRFLFRIDPDGILAVRIGSPLAFAALLGILMAAYLLGWSILGPGSLVAGAAVGLAAFGFLDDWIARAVAGEPRESVLRSRMNLFLPKEALQHATLREGVRITRLESDHGGMSFVLDVTRPEPGEAVRRLAPLLAER